MQENLPFPKNLHPALGLLDLTVDPTPFQFLPPPRSFVNNSHPRDVPKTANASLVRVLREQQLPATYGVETS